MALFLVGCKGGTQPYPTSVLDQRESIDWKKPEGTEKERVLVVVNDGSQDSQTIGEYYVRKRGVPKANLVHLNLSTTENVSPDEYRFSIEKPVRAAINKCKSRIDYIVLTKGVPIRLRDNNGYSVDGHLMAMELNVQPIEQPTQDQIRNAKNPYYDSTKAFNSADFKMFLVTRLDGYSLKDCMALIDHSMTAKPLKGPFFFDGASNRQGQGYKQMEDAMAQADKDLSARGFESKLDLTTEFMDPKRPLMGYCSWGSNDGAFDLATYRKINFLPGAICETFVSTSGRTFNPTTGGQSLIADLIQNGATGVKGYVSEPYVFALANPAILFNRYTNGMNLAESFYAASLVIKWKDVVIGDPICRPYARD